MAVVRSREDLSYMEISRPVETGLEVLMAHVQHDGVPMFGYRNEAVDESPAINTGSADEPLVEMRLTGIQSPRLTVYQNGGLRLPMVDLTAPPQARMKFSGALQRLLGNPEEAFPEARAVLAAEEEALTEKKRRDNHTGLAEVFAQLGVKHGVEDQNRLEVECIAATVATHSLLSHTGREVVLILDTSTAVGTMLLDQVDVCFRGLARKSKEIALPERPSVLKLPICHLPPHATEQERRRFVSMVNSRLPQSVALGGFNHRSGGPPPETSAKKSRAGQQ